MYILVACDILNVSPSVSKLIFLKVQSLKVKSSQSFVFVLILKLPLKRGLQKDTQKVWTLGHFFPGLQKDTLKVWTLGHFFPKKNSIPFLHKMLIAKVFQTFCGWFRVSFLPLICLTSQTIQCDASQCCECMHCLLTLTFLKALYMHLLIWGSA